VTGADHPLGEAFIDPMMHIMYVIGSMGRAEPNLLDVAERCLSERAAVIEALLVTARQLVDELEMGAAIEASP
jgi:hypothetical protein